MSEPPTRPAPGVDPEPPRVLTRSEYVSAIVHLYRGELYRATTWRLRLDRTTNWAVLTTAGLLTFAFQRDTGMHTHWILLLGIALVTVFLFFEARRFQFEDVWRARVRILEEHFYAPVLRGEPIAARWGGLFARDLGRPRFKITLLQAVRARLVRNYWAVYSLLTAAWVLKVVIHPEPSAATWEEVRGHLAMGLLPWWVPLAYLGAHALGLLTVLLATRSVSAVEQEYWSVEPEGFDGCP